MTADAAPLGSILVVDDTVENLRLLASMLGETGYEIRAVTSGRQALQAVEHDPPDLLLLDINMPEMNGYEVCAALKARPEFRDIPVVFLTASSETADKVRAFEMGGVDYVTKPFQVEEVVARVKVHVALRRARHDLSQSFDRLLELEKLRDDLVRMFVHDMRSPLTVLKWSLEFLRNEAGPTFSDAANDEIAEALRAVGFVTSMANELLDVSRLEEGKMPVDRTSNDLGEMARDVLTALAGLERGRAIDLDVEGPVDAACDRALIRRVLENLIVNGIKHTPASGRLRVAMTNQGERVRVIVEDEGAGVPAELRTKIFDKFCAVATRKDQKYHSAGLGLAFCRLAVEAHGGSIGVDPREQAGSAFWFELPIAAPPQ